jgi:hypothetical protein
MPEPTPPAADRNLLFGILALQLDFINKDDLMGAMHAWVLDKARPHGQVLVGQGTLRAGAPGRLPPAPAGQRLGSGGPGGGLPEGDGAATRGPVRLRPCPGRRHHLVDLEARLPALLDGEAQSAGAAERLDVARLCVRKKRYAEAARFYAEAFAEEPRLADSLRAGHGYDAACAAALAASKRYRWRPQTLAWLRADLAARAVDGGAPSGRAWANMLRHWQRDADLASVPDLTALARLPPEECVAWVRLWADVAALRDRAAGQGPTPK